MADHDDESRRKLAQALLEARQQRREIVELLNDIVAAWCEVNGVTRAELEARAAALPDDDDDELNVLDL